MPIPVIGITTRNDLTRAGLPAVMVQQAYINAIVRAGGAPVLIPSDLPEESWRELFNCLYGILFSGGGDIAVKYFGEQENPKVANVDEARDSIELGLARSAADEGKPFLGICRGLQLINVALGGTLFTDISDQIPGALNHDWKDSDIYKERAHLAHSVRIEDGSRAAEILGGPILQVNSLHHQGIKDLAPSLKAAAYAPDGIVEAIELQGHPFGIAVQWHPEWLVEQESARQLFRAFVIAAGAKK
jgi:putative glutamine amidotransferase